MLTVKQIEAAKPKEKPYRLLDGNGLYLYVPVSGKKVWQLRYKIDGKEKILTVGKYPLMTLQEARDKAWTARKDISVGWISCSERMPDTKTAVLVAVEFDRKGDWRMKWATYIPGHPDANDGWIIPGASWKPSHWMPLPEPPL